MKKNNGELKLKDLIEIEMLQRIQDAFADMTGMAVVTVDENGVPVTKASNFTDFCNKYTRMTETGRRRCEECDIKGAARGLETGEKRPYYYCHAGLVDFAAPIMAGDKMIGGFIGGQVLTSPPEPEKFAKIAEEIGVDPEKYVEAVQKVEIVSEETVAKTSGFLCTIASALSNTAYKSHVLQINALEIKKASRMKSDFLANMSHEIRTPMNAIIGLADLALREEMSPTARDFVHQVKASGKNLLVIINDILDFSKIESGKMDIIESEYMPLSLVNDLTCVINSRIGSKDIEFTMDVPPALPKNLYGDNVRIHQVLLNVLTNAAKFTQQGEIHLKMEIEHIEDNMLMMKVSVSDTGIGIKKNDLNKLFTSFQQLDSKRNRNIEGTGLGLAITKQLLTLMHGSISVESEYNKGTTFTIELPQKIIDDIPAMEKPENVGSSAILISNPYVKKQLLKDLEWIGSSCIDLTEESSLEDLKADFLFVERLFFSQAVQKFLLDNPRVRGIVLTDYNNMELVDIPNVKVISKPAYSLAVYNAMEIADVSVSSDNADESGGFTFAAPEARILVVDDNPVNLTVAKGLLEPLHMRIDTALSAAEAIEAIHKEMYDLIFMDHMMPEVDGVEATHIIRRLVPRYKDIPIIALTANAIGGAREMFIKEGMNDFCAKPIEVKDILSKLRKWLPKEKILHVTDVSDGSVQDIPELVTKKTDMKISGIRELDVGTAVKMLGSEELYRVVLKEYYCSIEKKHQSIAAHRDEEQWRDYTVEVHSLKSTSKQIGADHLSALAAELERAGNEGNTEYILLHTDEMLDEYLKLKEILRPYFPECEEDSGDKPPQTADIFELLEKMHEALDNFDTLQIDEVVEQMSRYTFADRQGELFERLKQAAEESDIEVCDEIVTQWGKLIVGADDDTISGRVLLDVLDTMQAALDDFDTLEIDEAIEKIAKFKFTERGKEYYERLKEAAESYNLDSCNSIVKEWRKAAEEQIKK
ncbi:MAG: response regulator [Ruminococcaceae bacterium]|nr:response regulator [Oscillospiraceae bacterium]